MTSAQRDVDALVDFCKKNLGEQEIWSTPEGYPDSLALCIIDAIYSTGSHYTSVTNVIARYREAGGSKDGASALLRSFEEAGGPRPWAETVAQNVKPANTRPGAPLKADVIRDAAQLMVDLEIDTVADLDAEVGKSPQDNRVHTRWKKLTSQRSGVTYNYLLILAGQPSVKPDRMVLRFLADALDREDSLSTTEAVDLISAAAEKLEVSPRTLDHVVWRYASGRELTD
ncbi:hypothetical protein SAMN04489860_0813 [Paraoerskovia marina]|uniref:Heme peroxidase n=1 Tax=Paraoerskovia marina TaxID=545619 RepID=A0A1H1PIK7_9CELL|nr:hypothetical protein [Paraoerskovia marina]SDS10910.1 hypothetical protein SAMN04489860_0813 [Paraoerskovia marina]